MTYPRPSVSPLGRAAKGLGREPNLQEVRLARVRYAPKRPNWAAQRNVVMGQVGTSPPRGTEVEFKNEARRAWLWPFILGDYNHRWLISISAARTRSHGRENWWHISARR
jgi:hypothetical protein